MSDLERQQQTSTKACTPVGNDALMERPCGITIAQEPRRLKHTLKKSAETERFQISIMRRPPQRYGTTEQGFTPKRNTSGTFIYEQSQNQLRIRRNNLVNTQRGTAVAYRQYTGGYSREAAYYRICFMLTSGHDTVVNLKRAKTAG